ncbi:MAG TPA: hypothetical protein V6D06_18455, partial [Trichocoleus sp.]
MEHQATGFAAKGHLTQRQRRLLLAATAVSSSCGLAIELLLGNLASYLVGNQALAYGVAVGGFLAAMGLGAYLSRFIGLEESGAQAGAGELEKLGSGAPPADSSTNLLVAFAWVELGIAPLSALLPLALFALFVVDGPVWLGLALVTLLLGTL